MKLEKLARFNKELEVIVLFIAKDSPNRALEFYDELRGKLEQIPFSPLIYRKRENSKDENVRELIFKGYTVPFLIDREEDKIVILGIFSQNIWDEWDLVSKKTKPRKTGLQMPCNPIVKHFSFSAYINDDW